MIRFAADEAFDNDVIRALLRSLPDANIVGVREAGRGGRRILTFSLGQPTSAAFS